MPSRHHVSIVRAIGSRRAFPSIATALGFVACAAPALAQPAAPAAPISTPAPSTFQARIDAAAMESQSYLGYTRETIERSDTAPKVLAPLGGTGE